LALRIESLEASFELYGAPLVVRPGSGSAGASLRALAFAVDGGDHRGHGSEQGQATGYLGGGEGLRHPRDPTSAWRLSVVALVAHGILHFRRRQIPQAMKSMITDKVGWAIQGKVADSIQAESRFDYYSCGQDDY